MSSELYRTTGEDTTPSIVPMESRHTDRCMELWGNRFGPGEHRESWLHDARLGVDESTMGFVAVTGARVVGFGICAVGDPEYARGYVTVDVGPEGWPAHDVGIMHIGIVDERHEGRGIGSSLFARRLEWLSMHDVREVVGVAWHREDHVDSRVLFEKFGFEAMREIKEYYQRLDGPVPCVDCGGSCRCDATIYRKRRGEATP